MPECLQISITALSEAKDICLYLKPLVKHIHQLEEIDFSECTPLLAPLMHVICLIYVHSKHYNQLKLVVLLKQICNLLIKQAKRYLDPSSIFHSDIDEAMQRITYSLSALSKFQSIFHDYKDNMGEIFKNHDPQPWTFHPDTIFERYNTFLDRLNTIQVINIYIKEK